MIKQNLCTGTVVIALLICYCREEGNLICPSHLDIHKESQRKCIIVIGCCVYGNLKGTPKISQFETIRKNQIVLLKS